MKEKDMKVIQKTLQNLTKNNMQAHYCDTSEKALELIKTMINKGDTVTHGGSVTLSQAGVTDLLKNGEYNYIDRSTAKSPEELEKIYTAAFSADVFFSSSNAVTQSGELYNVDGNSNRVAAILYGPKSVIILCGYNKIVRDLDEAVYRVKTTAAPLNCKRLKAGTYCEQTGECLSLSRDVSFVCDGCQGDNRICCNYVVCSRQRHKDRIKVIIVGEELGY